MDGEEVLGRRRVPHVRASSWLRLHHCVQESDETEGRGRKASASAAGHCSLPSLSHRQLG